ncbi:MAG: ribosome biogenesis GTP-binding protein YihA/YsxC [Leptospirales bacterium]|nr:ribosome biogenesis GTP-binding protein YihA/YsxC [Leptospirales bacterium]
MKFDNAKFIKSCERPNDFPQYGYPEFAFFGRSNTGKSSLINMILGKKNLVKTGSKPGVTRLINFFTTDDPFSFADLPGFGYASVPLSVKKKFMPMIKSYAQNRKNLKLAFLLMDIRRIPGDFENEMIDFLSSLKIPTAIVLTKCDKLSANKRAESLKKITSVTGLSEDSFFFSSAHTGEGKKELRSLIKNSAGATTES